MYVFGLFFHFGCLTRLDGTCDGDMRVLSTQ